MRNNNSVQHILNILNPRSERSLNDIINHNCVPVALEVIPPHRYIGGFPVAPESGIGFSKQQHGFRAVVEFVKLSTGLSFNIDVTLKWFENDEPTVELNISQGRYTPIHKLTPSALYQLRPTVRKFLSAVINRMAYAASDLSRAKELIANAGPYEVRYVPGKKGRDWNPDRPPAYALVGADPQQWPQLALRPEEEKADAEVEADMNEDVDMASALGMVAGSDDEDDKLVID